MPNLINTISCAIRFGRFVLAFMMGIAGPSLGLAGTTLPNYSVRNWLTEDGLPEDSVTSTIQTDDGYIWLGTYSGLARFDGVRFIVFDSSNTPELAASRISCLFQDKQGTLWIGHESGELTRYGQDGHFHSEVVRVSWKGRKIFAITADERGDLWLVNDQGVMGRFKDGLVDVPPVGGAVNLVGVARGLDGSVWVTRDGNSSVLRHGVLTSPELDGPPEQSYIQGICPSHDGKLWVASKGILRKWHGTDWEDEGMPAPWEQTPLTAFIEMANGTLAAGTQDKGLYLISPKGDTINFSRTNGLLNDWVRSLCADHEGNLWVGTGGGGLALLRASSVIPVNPPDQWQGRPVLSVFADHNGAVVAGTEGAGLYQFKDGQWTHFGMESGLRNLFVWSVAEDKSGHLFAGTWGGGLFIRDSDHFKSAPGLDKILVPMPALLPAQDGGLWVGTETGLLRYDGSNGVWFGQKGELGRADVRTIVEDPAGAVWFGLLGRGLARLKNGHVQHFTKADGLSSDFVQCLHLDDKGVLWIGTFGGGLNRFKNGSFTALTTRQGLPNNIIGCILDDDNGNFWLSSHAGLIRVSQRQLNLCADGLISSMECASFGKSDGLPTLKCSSGFQPAGCKTPDGRLWFPVGKSLVAVDPRAINVNHFPPPVVIEEVRVDGSPLHGAPGTLRIPPGQHRIEVDYTALSFVAPEKVRFRYQLNGLDNHWEEAGAKRSADFTYLPPGNYAFHVIACNNDGVWNATGAEFAFQLLPHFWQTSWFLVLSGAVIMAGAGAGVHPDARRRLRRRLERFERQRAVERERSRIARDIHDDLGATLTRISLLSDAVPTELVSPRQAGEALSRIFATSRQVVQALDEIVWAVNPRFDTLDSLASYLGNFAQELLETASIRCRLDMPVHLPMRPLTTEVRHNVFLAFKEALNNALKHSEATEVRICLALEGEEIVLSVEDNGKGFTPPLLTSLPSTGAEASDGFGLTNIHQRLAEIGGRCDIQSVPGGGSKVRFTVPLQVIYN